MSGLKAVKIGLNLILDQFEFMNMSEFSRYSACSVLGQADASVLIILLIS